MEREGVAERELLPPGNIDDPRGVRLRRIPGEMTHSKFQPAGRTWANVMGADVQTAYVNINEDRNGGAGPSGRVRSPDHRAKVADRTLMISVNVTCRIGHTPRSSRIPA